MKLISDNKVSQELVNSLDKEMSLELAKMLEEVNCNNPFDGLKDKRLLWSLTNNRTELTTKYIHIRDHKSFDEN